MKYLLNQKLKSINYHHKVLLIIIIVLLFWKFYTIFYSLQNKTCSSRYSFISFSLSSLLQLDGFIRSKLIKFGLNFLPELWKSAQKQSWESYKRDFPWRFFLVVLMLQSNLIVFAFETMDFNLILSFYGVFKE